MRYSNNNNNKITLKKQNKKTKNGMQANGRKMFTVMIE